MENGGHRVGPIAVILDLPWPTPSNSARRFANRRKGWLLTGWGPVWSRPVERVHPEAGHRGVGKLLIEARCIIFGE